MPKAFFQKSISLLLCLCFSTAVVLCVLQSKPAPKVFAERTVASVDEEIKECEALISRLQSEQKTLLAQLNDLQDQSASALEQAQLIAGQVALLETQIELNQSLLLSCDMKRATAQAEMILVQDEYEYYCGLLAELMRFIYESGTVNDFELLFSSDSLSDYLSRRDNFNSIMECVDDLRVSSEQSLLKLTELEEEYNVASEKYKTYLADLDSDKTELEEAIAELESLSDNLGLDHVELSGDYAALSTNVADAQAKLAQLKEERAELYKQEQNNQYAPIAPVDGNRFIWPLASSVSYRITSHYSTRTNPITGVGTEFHSGLDVAAAKGSPILAVAPGIVTKSAWYGGYGNCVIIYHGQDSQGRAVTSLYGHASKLICKETQQVKAGDLIAEVGTTGRSTGNHLHFSVLLDGVYVDPDDYLPNGYYEKLPNQK